jgi:hypothetical protein
LRLRIRQPSDSAAFAALSRRCWLQPALISSTSLLATKSRPGSANNPLTDPGKPSPLSVHSRSTGSTQLLPYSCLTPLSNCSRSQRSQRQPLPPARPATPLSFFFTLCPPFHQWYFGSLSNGIRNVPSAVKYGFRGCSVRPGSVFATSPLCHPDRKYVNHPDIPLIPPGTPWSLYSLISEVQFFLAPTVVRIYLLLCYI